MRGAKSNARPGWVDIETGEPEKPDALGFTEDVCRYCGDRVGYGVPELHISICDKPACQAKAKKQGKRRAKRYTKARGR